jgi:HD superfamily phosphohydrolase YqeK
LLAVTNEQADSRSEEASLQSEVIQLSSEIEQTYEEISLLHTLTQNLQISCGPVEVAQLCVSRMHGLIESAANIIWLEDKTTGSHFLIEGDIPFDEIGMARLIARFDDYDWARPLVKNRVQGSLLGSDYPGLENFVIVPISRGSHRSGWIISCNLSDDREFGSVEGSLLNSIATILGTHIRNIDLYQQHEDLLISFVRSLVSTLDAKDPYTRGHSERVALVSRRLGEHLNLPTDDLNDIYLSGMLHDVGKIGVDDRVLQKPGKLTNEEFDKIKEHPMIGYNILKGMKNLQKILPGVRYHHESYDGTGYPDGLRGEEIPLMARIMAVADAYDAMSSSRVYREGMPLDKLESIFRNGSGQQWDANIIDAYFEIREDILQICETYAPDQRNLLEGTRVTSEI